MFRSLCIYHIYYIGQLGNLCIWDVDFRFDDTHNFY
jgi:hypothetical protein